jgi:hypothetical protein
VRFLKNSDGFSAVELLVTLFVAAIFLFSGYQVYLAIIKDGGEVRHQSMAGSTAYKYLQEYKEAGAPAAACTSQVLKNNEDVPDLDIADAKITIERSCPVSSNSAIYKILVTINYDGDKSVQQSTYYLHPTFKVPLDCPTGFIEVPGNSKFGTSDFCVMKYEAKNVGGIPTSQAAGLPWTSIPQYGSVFLSGGKSSPSSILTDGSTATSPYYASPVSNALQHVTVDLGSAIPLYHVGIWHYWSDSRTYSGTKTEISTNGSDWTTIFDSANEGTYTETSAGRFHSFETQNVRYIRDYIYGSSANTGNHWTEVAAYGPAAGSAYTVSQSACSGCGLITEAQWLTIAADVMSVPDNWTGGAVGSGALYSGHNDASPNNMIAASTSDTSGYTGTGNSGTSNQRRTLKLTNGEVIWDFAGNAGEWTSGTVTGNGNQPGISGQANAWRQWNASGLLPGKFATSFPSYGSPSASGWSSSQGMGQVLSNYADLSLRSAQRGGNFGSGVYAGVYSLILDHIPMTAYPNVGFRVTR